MIRINFNHVNIGNAIASSVRSIDVPMSHGLPLCIEPWVEGAGEADSGASLESATHSRDYAWCTAGESLHVLSALERRSSRRDTDPRATANALIAAVSLVLYPLGRDPESNRWTVRAGWGSTPLVRQRRR